MASFQAQAVGAERTRQQLQELDALLKQMLALPLAEESAQEPREAEAATSPARETPPLPAPEARVEKPPVLPVEPTAFPVKKLTPLKPAKPSTEPPAPKVIAAKFPQPLRLESVQRPASVEKSGLSVFAPESRTASPYSQEEAETTSPRPAVDALDPLRFDLGGPADLDLSAGVEHGEAVPFPPWQDKPEEAPMPDQAGSSLAYHSLVGVNRVLETPLRMLGPVGEPLLASKGLNFLGWLGLILLTGSAALALGVWLGWTW